MNKKVVSLIAGAAVLFNIVACKKADLSTDKGRYSYIMGYNFGTQIKKDNVEIDVKSFMAALEDALKGKENALTLQEIKRAEESLDIIIQNNRRQAADENLVKGTAFLETNKVKEGVNTTSSGLQYRVIKQGTGRKPKATDTVTVHYTGKFIDGKEFGSSYVSNQPLKFKVDGVIKGWAEGLQLMPAGSKYELIIPPSLGYGQMGYQSIPGGSVLVFEIELIKVGK